VPCPYEYVLLSALLVGHCTDGEKMQALVNKQLASLGWRPSSYNIDDADEYIQQLVQLGQHKIRWAGMEATALSQLEYLTFRDWMALG
jgi:hypothetical protein